MSARYVGAELLAAGSVLAERYRLIALLGRGGMGEVWAARHLLTGKAVAVKRLVCPAEERSFGEARARFALEAKSACAVEHPNVVEVFDFIESDERAPFIVMELLRGETLAARLARGPLGSAEQVATLLLPVVSAVGTAHERGIVHRDLKPSNIFLDTRPGERRPLVKVLDFGIAKWLMGDPEGGGLRTRTGSTLGTPSYMAPEQATGDRNADHRADIWSIGVILYEALSGVRPLEGDNAAQLVMRLLSTGIMPIEHLVPELPRELAALVGRMLSRDVARRPGDLREVYGLLSALSGEAGVAFGPPRSHGGEAANGVPASIAATAATAPSRDSATFAAKDSVTTQRTAQTQTAIEMSLVSPSGARRPERARRPQPRVYLGLLGVAAVLLGGTLFWLGRGAASLASPGPEALAPGPARAGIDVTASAVLPGPPRAAPEAAAGAGAAAAPGVALAGAIGVAPPPGGRGDDKARSGAGVRARSDKALAKRPRTAKRAAPSGAAAHGAAAKAADASSAPGSNAAALSAARPAAGAPRGAECESSGECQSRLCAAYACQ